MISVLSLTTARFSKLRVPFLKPSFTWRFMWKFFFISILSLWLLFMILSHTLNLPVSQLQTQQVITSQIRSHRIININNSLMLSGGLTIVPMVPWQGASRWRGPPTSLEVQHSVRQTRSLKQICSLLFSRWDGTLCHFRKMQRVLTPVWPCQVDAYRGTTRHVSTALRMFVCLMVSNCSGERSFSRMTFIKNKLRSTMTDERLSALELLSVESDVLHQISFSNYWRIF